MDLPVAKHFSSPGHDAADMLVHLSTPVSVICAGFAGNTVQRRLSLFGSTTMMASVRNYFV